MKKGELHRHGITEMGIVLYRLKAMELRQVENGLWFKRIRIYHPLGLLTFIIMLVATPFVVLFGEMSIQMAVREISEEFITGVKTT